MFALIHNTIMLKNIFIEQNPAMVLQNQLIVTV